MCKFNIILVVCIICIQISLTFGYCAKGPMFFLEDNSSYYVEGLCSKNVKCSYISGTDKNQKVRTGEGTYYFTNIQGNDSYVVKLYNRNWNKAVCGFDQPKYYIKGKSQVDVRVFQFNLCGGLYTFKCLGFNGNTLKSYDVIGDDSVIAQFITYV
ncbi:hypothetical protein PIROE2DRAFT_17828 [Piromyces sp. E2]|nr:hypothetical protein PIROE2DRAFT_17828 [Piromyces sp. E2]|eukprot:OUM57247.1 hypothetical protein PIROE2DRAFT_17828 [Piromyces sp. E2]